MCVCVFGLVQGACSQSLLRGDACVCQGVCLGLCKAHAPCDCCEAMHVCACLCVLMHEAHGHCDCCEAMHACVECVICFVEGICSRCCCEAMDACVCSACACE
jgi:hypothetical protein